VSRLRDLVRRLGPLVVACLTCWTSSVWAGPDDPHGFIEPCTVGFVEDSTVRCESCIPTREAPERCAEEWGSRGYEKHCQTNVHSAPGEVWCIEKERPLTTRHFVLGALAALAAALAGTFLFVQWRRRGAE
jgi:hypothetical protein